MAKREYTPEQKERRRETSRLRTSEWIKANRERERQNKKEYYAKNSEKVKAKVKQWEAEHPEQARANKRKSAARQRAANPDKFRERDRLYNAKRPKVPKAPKPELSPEEKRTRERERLRKFYADHREQERERSRRKRVTNPEKQRERQRRWAREHPEARENKRARRLGAPGRHTRGDILHLFREQQGLCAGCLVVLVKSGKGKYHIDHVMPLIRGGSNGPENLQLLCPPCNHRKADKHPDAWAKIISGNDASGKKRSSR